jgi:hypothetical protein
MSNAGKTLTAVWAMRYVRETLTPTERHVLHAFFSFMNAAGVASPGHAALIRETGYVKRTIISAIEGLVRAGLLVVLAESQLLPVKRCAVYKVMVELITQSDDTIRDLVSPEHAAGDRSSEIVIDDPVQLIVDPCSGDPGAPLEDPDEEEKRISEDSSPSLASPPSTPPTTARSPATMPPAPEALLASSQDPTTPPPPPPAKQRKPKATKPKLAPLMVDQLTTEERAVHDAIVQDPTLVLICHNVPQLARDLVAIANGRIDVVAKVRALGVWNRNNPSKAWTTAGGNRGLTNCVTRDAGQASSGYPSTRFSPTPAPANGTQAPRPPRVQIVAPPPPPRDDLPKPLPGEETFLQRMARIDPQARRILEQNGKLSQ